MKYLIILMLLITSCSLSQHPQTSGTATASLKQAFPNAMIFEGVDDPPYYVLFDTVSHTAYKATLGMNSTGIGHIIMLKYVNLNDSIK